MADYWSGGAGNATSTNPEPDAAGAGDVEEPWITAWHTWAYEGQPTALEAFEAGYAAANARADRLAAAITAYREAWARLLAGADTLDQKRDDVALMHDARNALFASSAGDAPGRGEASGG